jgi:hypothetical protein
MPVTAAKPAPSTDHLTLKWGTLKSWDFSNNEKAVELMKQYVAIGSAMGAAQQRDTPEQKELICQMIDAVDCEKIYLDWDGKYVSKDEAKKYVQDYKR